MHFGNVQRGEIIAAIGGVLLAIAVFLPWYHTADANPNSIIDDRRGSFSAWDVHPVARFLFLAAAAAPLILMWIIVREHQLSWPRGELTALVGITAGVLALVLGFIARPGDPRDTITLEIGWYVALLSSVTILVGAVQRSSETRAVRKPPGVL